MLIVASVIQLFHLTPYAVARSLASQQMGEDEQGQFHVQSFTLLYIQCFLCPSRIALLSFFLTKSIEQRSRDLAKLGFQFWRRWLYYWISEFVFCVCHRDCSLYVVCNMHCVLHV